MLTEHSDYKATFYTVFILLQTGLAPLNSRLSISSFCGFSLEDGEQRLLNFSGFAISLRTL